jgi:hypothetical protein
MVARESVHTCSIMTMVSGPMLRHLPRRWDSLPRIPREPRRNSLISRLICAISGN